MSRFLIGLRQLEDKDTSVMPGPESRGQSSHYSSLNFRTVLEDRVLGNLGESLDMDARIE